MCKRSFGRRLPQRFDIENIRSNLAEHGFAGVTIDFELLTKRDREVWIQFMRELTDKLHESSYVVSERCR